MTSLMGALASQIQGRLWSARNKELLIEEKNMKSSRHPGNPGPRPTGGEASEAASAAKAKDKAQAPEAGHSKSRSLEDPRVLVSQQRQ